MSISNGREFTLSCWIYTESTGATRTIMDQRNGSNFATISASEKISLRLRGATTNPAVIFSGTNSLSRSAWHHIAISLTTGASTTPRHVYVDGSAYAGTWSTWVDESIMYAGINVHNIGAGAGGTSKWNGGLCEFYFDDVYFDLSAAENLAIFRTGAGKPADLGSYGTSARWYMKTPVPSWETNSGNDGAFTENGTLTDGGANKP
jgi:hypothetical protein